LFILSKTHMIFYYEGDVAQLENEVVIFVKHDIPCPFCRFFFSCILVTNKKHHMFTDALQLATSWVHENDEYDIKGFLCLKIDDDHPILSFQSDATIRVFIFWFNCWVKNFVEFKGNSKCLFRKEVDVGTKAERVLKDMTWKQKYHWTQTAVHLLVTTLFCSVFQAK